MVGTSDQRSHKDFDEAMKRRRITRPNDVNSGIRSRRAVADGG